MDTETQAAMQDMLARFMQSEPEARSILCRLFFAYATRDWATEVPESSMEAAPAMAAMHHACQRGNYVAALAHLKMWAGLLGVAAGGAVPERGER